MSRLRNRGPRRSTLRFNHRPFCQVLAGSMLPAIVIPMYADAESSMFLICSIPSGQLVVREEHFYAKRSGEKARRKVNSNRARKNSSNQRRSRLKL